VWGGVKKKFMGIWREARKGDGGKDGGGNIHPRMKMCKITFSLNS
jgi:hypothetical protein